MDSTFKCSSKQFSQIYSIHADFGSTDEETDVNPVVFALFPNKKKETYIRLFRLIPQAVPEWKLERANEILKWRPYLRFVKYSSRFYFLQHRPYAGSHPAERYVMSLVRFVGYSDAWLDTQLRD